QYRFYMEDRSPYNVSIISLAHFIGYGFLLLALLNCIEILVPFDFFKPAWGFQTFGAFVERSGIPLLGFALIFLEGNTGRGRIEKEILLYLSWLALVIGIIFFLLLPLGLGSAYRIHTQNQTQIAAQLSQQENQFKQLSGQVTRASEPELARLAAQLKQQGRSIDTNDLSALRNQILSEISNNRAATITQANAVKKSQFLSLLKNTVKWVLGAVIYGFLFIYIWKVTYWVRLPGYLE
ncbi:MAG: HpsJ family protein, partial [Leptolyngbyaceae bacterium]|nr:HpsJ family protein [Leptolyngbyaceae bacterium]